MNMEKQQLKPFIILMVLCCVAITGCGKKEDEAKEQTPPVAQTPPPPAPVPDMGDQEKAREYIQQQMAQMEARVAVMDAKAAYALALAEAKKWDAQAKLYQLKGEKKLTPDGTASMWTAYFATQTDASNTPRQEQGKKLTVLMSDGRVMKVSPKETPDDIKFAAPCRAFLPVEKLNSKETLAKCIAGLKSKHDTAADSAELKRLIYTSRDNDAGYQPVWELNASVNGSSATIVINAATGMVMDN
jgi:hypothetical protein